MQKAKIWEELVLYDHSILPKGQEGGKQAYKRRSKYVREKENQQVGNRQIYTFFEIVQIQNALENQIMSKLGLFMTLEIFKH